MATKMTKKDWYNELKEVVETVQPSNAEGMLDFINHEIDLLNAKAQKHSKTKVQKENEVVIDKIILSLSTCDAPITVTELMTLNEEMQKYSNQKLSALLKQLVDNGKVVKTYDKKKALFSLA